MSNLEAISQKMCSTATELKYATNKLAKDAECAKWAGHYAEIIWGDNGKHANGAEMAMYEFYMWKISGGKYDVGLDKDYEKDFVRAAQRRCNTSD